MENTEIIKALRLCAKSGNIIDYCELGDDNGCLYSDNCGDCIDNLLRAAADALEAAEKRIVELNTKCANLQSQINEMENEIEELMPKRGEWIGIEYDGYADGYPVYDVWECSECGEEHNGEEDTLPNYCPNCGADMRKGEHDEQADS